MREPRKRQQAAAAARNNVAPVDRSTNLMEMPLDEFQGALSELAQQGVDTDALLRQYRAANSPFAAVNRAAEASSAELAAAGRRPVAGTAGLLSRPIDDAGGVRFEPAAGLLGMLAGAGRQIDAPMAAYQELIPAEDMDLEALGTAGVATLGGGAVTRPAGSVGMGGRVVYRGDTDSDQRISGGISEGNLFVTPYEDIARLYGDKISQFNIPSTARVLVEGTPEFAKVTGRRRGPLLRTMRQGENLVQASTDAVNAAKAAGYDAVEFNSMRDLGISIINPDILAANASPESGLLSAAAARTPAEQMARQILDMRAAGRAGDVTDEMMAAADPQYMFANTPLPMDEASRMARAGEMGFPTGQFEGESYHLTPNDFQSFREGPTWGRVDPSTNPAAHNVGADYTVQGASDMPIFMRGDRAMPSEARNMPSGSSLPFVAPDEWSAAMSAAGKDFYELGNERIGLNPSNIRSRFARFDPEFAHLSNLNAANIDPLSGLFGAMAAEEQRRQRNAP